MILNPGTVPNEGYMAVSDIIMVFEDQYSAYQTASFPTWMAKYSTVRLSHLVYNCSAANMPNVVTLANARYAGYLYVTDDTLPNPWNSLASYINAEKAMMGSSTTTPPPTTDYQALYNAAVAASAQKDQQIAALTKVMADFKAGLISYINTH